MCWQKRIAVIQNDVIKIIGMANFRTISGRLSFRKECLVRFETNILFAVKIKEVRMAREN